MTSGYVKDRGEEKLSMEALIEILKAVIEKGRYFRFQVLGFSMYPFIRDNDFITISPLVPSYPRLGDIVAFIQPATRKLKIHRIIENKEVNYLIKGDNTFEPDGLIPRANILGYVTKVERNGKAIRLGSRIERVFLAFISHKKLLSLTHHLFFKFINSTIRRIKT